MIERISLSRKLMYLDESGNHDLKKIDPNYPVFVLGGVIVEEGYAETVMEEEVSQFKMSWFGSTSPVLHTADITRNRLEFEILKHRKTRERFQEDLNALMRRLEYSVVSAVVQKNRLRGRFYRRLDLYSLSFEFLLEAFHDEVHRARGHGRIVAERRTPEFDKRLDDNWDWHLKRGVGEISGREIRQKIKGLDLRSKAENIAGLQIADLVVTPIGRHVAGKPDKEDFEIVWSKMLNGGSDDPRGLIVLP